METPSSVEAPLSNRSTENQNIADFVDQTSTQQQAYPEEETSLAELPKQLESESHPDDNSVTSYEEPSP